MMKNMNKGFTVPKWVKGRKYPKCPRIHLHDFSVQAQWISMKKGFNGCPYVVRSKDNVNHMLRFNPKFLYREVTMRSKGFERAFIYPSAELT